ncbi:hypothetical protein GY45DRAFT_911262 [Cubamyces sp. BRFM 1775]|nr:hypothetical protein GY45DRAFT_911262 [Cubamyces sp. BRFM 1775]
MELQGQTDWMSLARARTRSPMEEGNGRTRETRESWGPSPNAKEKRQPRRRAPGGWDMSSARHASALGRHGIRVWGRSNERTRRKEGPEGRRASKIQGPRSRCAAGVHSGFSTSLGRAWVRWISRTLSVFRGLHSPSRAARGCTAESGTWDARPRGVHVRAPGGAGALRRVR